MGLARQLVEADTPESISVDFDNVIHAMDDGFKDGEIYGDPVEGAFEGLKLLMAGGRPVFIMTARTDLEAVVAWIKTNAPELKPELIPKDATFWSKSGILGITNRKLPAARYIDDRADKFTDWKSVELGEGFLNEIAISRKIIEANELTPHNVAGKILKPNHIYLWGNDWTGRDKIPTMQSFPYEGSPIEALNNAEMGDMAVHVILATDSGGRPSKVISPNLRHIADFGTPEAQYIAGDVHAIDRALRQRIGSENDHGKANELLAGKLAKIEADKQKYQGFIDAELVKNKEDIAALKSGKTISDLDSRYDSTPEGKKDYFEQKRRRISAFQYEMSRMDADILKWKALVPKMVESKSRRIIEFEMNPAVKLPKVDLHQRMRMRHSHGGGGNPPGIGNEDESGDDEPLRVLLSGEDYEGEAREIWVGTSSQIPDLEEICQGATTARERAIKLGNHACTSDKDGLPWRSYSIWWNNPKNNGKWEVYTTSLEQLGDER